MGSGWAIVTDGQWRKSLSAVRSLGRAGYQVSVLGDSLFTASYWSAYTSRRIRTRAAAQDPKAFGEALLDEARRLHALSGNKPVVLPMEDPSLRWVSEHRSALEKHADLIIPSPSALDTAWKKDRTLALAESLGVACPKTTAPTSDDEFLAAIRSLKDGFVVKPTSGTGSQGVAYGPRSDRDDRGWREHWTHYGPLVVQERIPAEGEGLGASILVDASGTCVAAFAHKRLRQYPVSGGPSTDRVSIHAPELITEALKLLKALDWRGVAMVEFKRDPRDGRAKLMEINPRFWGSLELAARSGVDFALLYARAASGEKLTAVEAAQPTYPAGVRARWMIPGDVLRYLSDPRREGFFEFLSGLPGLAEEWDARDPQGAIAMVLCTAALALNPAYWKYLRRG